MSDTAIICHGCGFPRVFANGLPFASSSVAGKDSAHEAWQWLYERGELGRTIILSRLLSWLADSRMSKSITPRECKLHRLCIELQTCGEADVPKITQEFQPLLALESIKCLRLTIRIARVLWWSANIPYLAATILRVGMLANEFKADGVDVEIEWNFKGAPPVHEQVESTSRP